MLPQPTDVGVATKESRCRAAKPTARMSRRENIANAAQKVTETLGFKTPGMFFQPPDRIAAAGPPTGGPQPAPPTQPDPAVALALAQIEIAKQSAAADVEIKRLKAEADIEIAQWKARQWAEVERYKAGLKARLDEQELQHKTTLRGLDIATGNGAAGPAQSPEVPS